MSSLSPVVEVLDLPFIKAKWECFSKLVGGFVCLFVLREVGNGNRMKYNPKSQHHNLLHTPLEPST